MKRILPITAVLLISFLAFAFVLSKGKDKGKPAASADGVVRTYKSKPVKSPVLVKLSDGIEYTITAKGNGKLLPVHGSTLKIMYVGKLTNDTVFDASYKHNNEPLPFHLGKHEVIDGWDSVLRFAHAGDKISMTIPPKYGYGARPNGNIPANSTLKFDVEVIDITPPLQPWNAKGKDTIRTASGLKIVFFKTNQDSLMPENGDKVTVHYSGFLLDGKMFDSSVDRGTPLEFQIGRGMVIPGWDEGMMMMHKGDKAKLIIPAKLAFGDKGTGNGIIPPNAILQLDVELVNITPAPRPWDAKGKDTITLPSGLKMIMFETHPEAEMPKVGQNVSVAYSGFLTNGTMFDSSIPKGTPYTFPLGKRRVIACWDEAIALLHKGEKAKLIVPPSLGYGARANGAIPPNSILIFDVQLVDIK
jgi:peptidylprolyl isomerase